MGRSLREVSLDDVSGYAAAWERTIEERFWVVRVEGMVFGEVGVWKSSG